MYVVKCVILIVLGEWNVRFFFKYLWYFFDCVFVYILKVINKSCIYLSIDN